jgi:hypothetical protein
MQSTPKTGRGERRTVARRMRAMRPYTHFERVGRRFGPTAPVYRPFRVHG